MGIESLDPNNPAYLTFNDGGRSVGYDFSHMINMTETDTSISVDVLGRVLKYMAERHIDTISAKELGSILHLADIGDVDITDLADYSFLAYRKNSECAEDCDEGKNNAWYAWNSLEHLSDSLQYVMGYDADGKPLTLNTPAHTDQQYFLGWDRDNKLSYFQAREVATPPVDSNGKVQRLYRDPTTGEIVYVLEDA